MQNSIFFGQPQKGIFCGTDKYLRVEETILTQMTGPIMEDDSYFLLVREGRGTIRINGVDFPLEPGSVCWIYCYHLVNLIPQQESPLVLWSCEFDYQLANYLTFQSSTHMKTADAMYLCPVICRDDDITSIFELLRRYRDRSGAGESLIKASLAGQLSEHFKIVGNRPGFDADYPLGWKLCQYLAATSTSRQTVADVAEQFSLTVPEVNRCLRQTVGLDYPAYLCRLRTIAAASYLLFENLPADYVAARAGFRSELAFYRGFQKVMGMSPGAYRESVTKGSVGQYRGPIFDERLIAVVSYLYQHISEEITEDRLEKELFLSGSNIRKIVGDAFGISFREILSLFRVRYSQALLAATQLPLLDISVLVGFNSYSAFQRTFKRDVGLSPREYRKSCHLLKEEPPHEI